MIRLRGLFLASAERPEIVEKISDRQLRDITRFIALHDEIPLAMVHGMAQDQFDGQARELLLRALAISG